MELTRVKQRIHSGGRNSTFSSHQIVGTVKLIKILTRLLFMRLLSMIMLFMMMLFMRLLSIRLLFMKLLFMRLLF